jgi:hypothetical protein
VGDEGRDDGEGEKGCLGQKLSTNGGLWAFPLYDLPTPSLPLELLMLLVSMVGLDQDVMTMIVSRLMHLQANLPNLRRLFVEARTEVEENEYSRTAVRCPQSPVHETF